MVEPLRQMGSHHAAASACISLTLSSAFVLQLLQECTPKQIMSLSHAVVPGCSGLYEGSILYLRQKHGREGNQFAFTMLNLEHAIPPALQGCLPCRWGRHSCNKSRIFHDVATACITLGLLKMAGHAGGAEARPRGGGYT